MDKRMRLTKVELGVVILALLLLSGVAYKLSERASERSKITQAISNCRQIITVMRIYSPDASGKYPDRDVIGTKTANKAFRLLFEENILDNEMIFGCPLSPFAPDGVIADPHAGPNSSKSGKALQAGENHWAMTAGLSDGISGSIPLIYENPVSATWPPKWNADMTGNPVRGRAWKSGIIIGMNDSSVGFQPLASTHGAAVGLRPDPYTGKDLFAEALEAASDDVFKGEVLDVE
ncbi:hypothetical protein [Roseimicrobium sp. ORNL1]|uniref:type II secretion system protein n=1 Tax=Roseimicrobium sp. ORNL1 TaxID=2711231 RepID=UPI0013E19D75|nr:hypothetical protein [Roseimicrobium sp. ORNL1]QIF02575.1 hypothetical protein G5S37_13925 [Roseimicrobium sp. ORNL1]